MTYIKLYLNIEGKECYGKIYQSGTVEVWKCCDEFKYCSG